jgi:uncharacterized protein (TIGR02594 family)
MMNYSHLTKVSSPQILVEALKLVGTKEVVGIKHSATIMKWAKELKLTKVYTNDEIPWCGLFLAYCCFKAGVEMGITPTEALWVRNFLKFGTKQTVAKMGDIIVLSRGGAGHGGIYVGEDDLCYHIIGGNQTNMVNISRVEKTRVLGIRRTKWKIAQPESVKVVKLSASGFISKNEA